MVVALEATRRNNQMAHNAETTRHKRQLHARRVIENIHSKPVWFSSSLPASAVIKCKAELREPGLSKDTCEKCIAHILVTRDVAALGNHSLLVAALLGRSVVCPECYCSGGQKGVSVSYYAFNKTRRTIRLSAQFRARQAPAARAIDASVSAQLSKLKAVSAADVLSYHAADARKGKKQQRPMECLFIYQAYGRMPPTQEAQLR